MKVPCVIDQVHQFRIGNVAGFLCFAETDESVGHRYIGFQTGFAKLSGLVSTAA